MTAKELFGKHFNGLHYDDITEEKIEKYAIEFAKIHVTEASIKCAETVFNPTEEEIEGFNKVLNAYSLDNIL